MAKTKTKHREQCIPAPMGGMRLAGEASPVSFEHPAKPDELNKYESGQAVVSLANHKRKGRFFIFDASCNGVCHRQTSQPQSTSSGI